MKTEQDQSFETLLTYEQLSAVTGLSVAYLQKAKREMSLPHYDVAGIRFRLSEVNQWLADRKVQPRSAH